ncbi:MAG: FAD-binding oxidoreductase [Candidatus Latescibacteria bacterium]|nr:FAD-binding oxidoreductase [Candidatus Latescibacterota bacterium]
MKPSAGWGLYPVVEAQIDHPRYLEDLVALARKGEPLLAQGNCRSYGDACLYTRVASALALEHLLEFDPHQGRLRAQAGITLDSLLRFCVPRGFFLPVTPGTKFPTLGGCIAADVHGKNHHRDGAIGRFVEELEMVLADGSQVRCSRREHPDLFRATLGGMGLTGIIYAATLRLRPIESSFIQMRTVRTGDFAEACELMSRTRDQYLYSVAWLDCLATGRHLGRSLVMLGNHALAEGREPLRLHSFRQRPVPFHLPGFALNSWSVGAFNTLFYRRQLRRDQERRVHYDPFFYPLDALSDWNRIYGRGGFLQYQFAIPFAGGLDLMREILGRIAASGAGSFLAVLKTFGPEEEGLLSFPLPGYTLALDFPLQGGRIIPFLQELTKLVTRAGGRIYLAKDAILEESDFAAMYPRLEEFLRIKRHYDPHNQFRSCQSDRLGLR